MIRPATEHDLVEILEIFNDAILNTTAIYAYNAQTFEERKLWFALKMEERYPFLVYEENKKVLGFATFGSFRPHPAYKYTIENSVYVHKEYRNHKVGTALLQELIRIAEEREFATMVAAIDANNKSSINMHEKLGFQYSGTISKAGFKFGKWLDLAFYQKNLFGPKNPSAK
jgi:phosphinothricin acetyltransferase